MFKSLFQWFLKLADISVELVDGMLCVDISLSGTSLFNRCVMIGRGVNASGQIFSGKGEL